MDHPPRKQWNGLHPGAEYTEEEREFLQAIDRYKRKHQRPYPTWIEILDLLRELGWRKILVAGAEPAAELDSGSRAGLTVPQIREIYRCYHEDKIGTTILARRFQVSRQCIHRIVAGKMHRDITGAGERKARAGTETKLTVSQRFELWWLYQGGHETVLAQLARQFGVSVSLVHKIVSGSRPRE